MQEIFSHLLHVTSTFVSDTDLRGRNVYSFKVKQLQVKEQGLMLSLAYWNAGLMASSRNASGKVQPADNRTMEFRCLPSSLTQMCSW